MSKSLQDEIRVGIASAIPQNKFRLRFMGAPNYCPPGAQQAKPGESGFSFRMSSDTPGEMVELYIRGGITILEDRKLWEVIAHRSTHVGRSIFGEPLQILRTSAPVVCPACGVGPREECLPRRGEQHPHESVDCVERTELFESNQKKLRGESQ